MAASDWIVLATVISACATVAIAVLTVFLVSENRKLRNVGKEPRVIAYLIPHPDGNGAVNMAFANVGMGLATDVSFSFDCDAEDFNSHHVLMTAHDSAAPIDALPAGERIVVLFGIGFELFGNVGQKQIGPLKPFNVKIDFSNIDGAQGSTSSSIDIRQFEGLPGMTNKPALLKIHDTLKSMDKRFEVLAKASNKFVKFVDVSSLENQAREARRSDPPKRASRKASE